MHDAKTLAAELMAAAEKATPQGQWRFSPWHIEEGAPAVRQDGYGIICTTAGDNTAQFIALCSPENIRTLCEGLAEAERDRDEATNWTDIVERHGTDQFDDLAEAWLALPAIQRVTNAVVSTFSKWADEGMMQRFRQHQLSMFQMAYVEGCLAGVKAAEAKTEAKLSALQEAMRSAMAIYQADDEDNIGEAMFLVLHAALARTAGGKDD